MILQALQFCVSSEIGALVVLIYCFAKPWAQRSDTRLSTRLSLSTVLESGESQYGKERTTIEATSSMGTIPASK